MKPARPTHGNRTDMYSPVHDAAATPQDVIPRETSSEASARADLLAAAGRRARRVLRRSAFSFATGRDALPLSKDARPLPRSFVDFQRLRAVRRF